MSDMLDWMVSRARSGRMSRREFLGRSTALGISTALASTLYSRAAHAEPKKGGTIRAGLTGGESTNTLDPGLAASVLPQVANCTWGEVLVDTTPDGGIDFRIAEDVSSSPDAKVWTFKIRQGLEFHDGKPVTAEDVMLTYKRHSDENSKSGALGLVKDITDMKAEGDKLEITMGSATADLPYLLTDYHLIIQPGGGIEDPNTGVGSGPYVLETFEPGVRYILKKFANYFDDNVGHADTIELLGISDNTARTAALQSGQVHMINRVDPKIAELLEGAPDVEVRATAGRAHYDMIMRVDTPPFDNNDLRMALKFAVKRQEMVDKILGGLGSVGNDTPINAAYPLFDPSLPQREFDAAKAAEYYKKSGHDGSPIVLRTAQTAFPGAPDAANLYAASCAEAGIPLQVQMEPDDGYWENIWNVAPFCMSYWGGRPTQDQMFSTAYLSTAEWNESKFKNATFDELLLAARGELDAAKRKQQYAEMSRIVSDEGGTIIPMFNDFVAGVRNEIGGWVDDPNQEFMNFRAPIRCWLA